MSERSAVINYSDVNMAPRLVATAGPLFGAIFKISGDVSVGRDTVNQICISDPLVSRQHCSIKAADGGFKIFDLESYNGTFVNGLPVGEQALNHCDRITIGDSQFLFLLHSDVPRRISDPVELNDQNLITSATIQMQRQDALYLHPAQQVGIDAMSRRRY